MHVAHAIMSRLPTSSNRTNPTRHNVSSANARRKSFETVALVGGLNIFRDGSGGSGWAGCDENRSTTAAAWPAAELQNVTETADVSV